MMPLPRRRETLIALRATKTAHGVARDVLNPHLDVPEFQRQVVPADEVSRADPPVRSLRRRAQSDRRFELLDWICITLIVALLFGLLVLGFGLQAPK
jgi:hypothetical protein